MEQSLQELVGLVVLVEQPLEAEWLVVADQVFLEELVLLLGLLEEQVVGQLCLEGHGDHLQTVIECRKSLVLAVLVYEVVVGQSSQKP